MKKEITGKTPEEARNNYHAFLRQYQAEFQRDVSDDARHIFYSRPVGKWLKAVKKGNKMVVTFHDDCPCSDPH